MALIDTIAEPQPEVRISITAKETLVPGDPVTMAGWKADSSNPVRDYGRLAGICEIGAQAGFSAQVAAFGDIKNTGWSWPDATPIFLNGQALSITPPSTGFLVRLGTSKDATTIDVGIDPISVLL